MTLEVSEIGVVILVVSLLASAISYNVDTTQPIIRQSGASGTAFGVSVGIHHSGSKRSLLVGAPKAMTPNNVREGMVYQCDINGTSTICTTKFGMELLQGDPLFLMKNQLFGQTLITSSGNTVVCAPQLKLKNKLERNGSMIESFYPAGICILYNDEFGEPTDIFPIRGLAEGLVDPRQPQQFILAQFGFSAAIGKDGQNLIFGCPECYTDRGNAFAGAVDVIRSHTRDANKNPIFYKQVTSTGTFGDYLGFSVALGTFFSAEVMYAVGRPKARKFRGGVSVLKEEVVGTGKRLSFVSEVQGLETGAMFGYSVAAVDLNSDGYSDLVVGAPFHGPRDAFNVGQVFVYISNETRSTFVSSVSLVGKKSGGMFGLTVISLGDIDLDGFEDFAVAAPFLENPENGVVYIYRGSPWGLRSRDASQVLKHMSVKSFGYALASALADDNNYPDVLVGAYQSEKVVLFRSRPVVAVNVSLTTIPETVSLENKACQGKVCFDMFVCLVYEVRPGAGTAKIPSLVVNYTLLLDSQIKTEDRLVTTDSSGADKSKLSDFVILAKANTTCIKYVVAVQDGIRNRLRQFVNEVTVTAVALPSKMSLAALPELEPIQDADLDFPVYANVSIKPDCVSVPCQPNLKVEILSEGTTASVVAGSGDEVVLHVLVTNQFDSSYNTQLFMTVDSPRLTFRKEDFLNCSTVEPCDPSLRCQSGLEGVLCDIGNPIQVNRSVELNVLLRESGLVGNESKLLVKINASSVDEEKDSVLMDNEDVWRINVTANATLLFAGAPIFSEDRWDNVNASRVVDLVSETVTRDFDEEFIHEFRWENDGPSPIPGLTVQLWWPVFGVGTLELLKIPPTISVFYRHKSEEVDVTEAAANCDVSYSHVDRSDWPLTHLPRCTRRRCMPIDCTVRQHVLKDGSLSFRLTSKFSLDTLVKRIIEQQEAVSNPEQVISSYGIASVMSDYLIYSQQVVGEVNTTVRIKIDLQECVPIWIVIVSVIGSLVLLAVTIVILYMVGFFKERHKGKIRLKPRSIPGPVAASDIVVGSINDENQLKRSSSSSSQKQSKSDCGSDGYENVKRQSRTPSVRDEDVFKMGTQQLQEEPAPARRWRPSDCGDALPEMFDMMEKSGRHSHSSQSQTTV